MTFFFKPLVGFVASTTILTTLMVIIFPGVTKWIIDDVIRAERPEKLWPLRGHLCSVLFRALVQVTLKSHQ